MNKPRKRQSIQLRTSLRLSLQYAFLYAVLSALVFVMAYWFTQLEVHDWISDQMESDAETLWTIYENDGAEALIERIAALSEVNFENARVFQLVDAQGEMVAGNIAEILDSDLPETIPATSIALNGFVHDEVDLYWMREDQIGPYRFVQGSGDHIVAEVLEALSVALVVGSIAIVLLGLLVGVWVGRITEERITAISSTLAKVSQGQLDQRIPLTGGEADDLSRVSVEVNVMLAKIGRLLDSQAQISNDIAHDLRTPLQRLRQRLEGMADADTIDPEDVASSLHQTEDIITTFNALLRIAQIEASDKTEAFAMTNLVTILSNVAEVFEPTAEDKGITIDTRLPVAQVNVFGDRDLLTQMVSNLVENAIKHCPSGTTVSVTAVQTPQGAVIEVSDDGLGVDPRDRERIFQRFFRGEDSRHSAGNGLGLALVKAVCEMHGVSIDVADNTPGAVFVIKFKAVE